MVVFSKPALSPKALYDKLRSQGMIFPNEALALSYLQHVGAFRLKAYWYDKQDPTTKKFAAGTNFSAVVEMYEFDRLLRAKAFYAIDRLEIAIRSTIANQLALRHGPHWYLDAKIFKPVAKWQYGTMLKKIEDEVGRASGRAYITSYNQTYDDPYIAQSWAVTECVTFGFWSRTYEILRDPNDKKAISKKFGIDTTEVFTSWLHTLTYFRNLIAHHEKLLNTKLAISASSYKTKGIKLSQNRSVYAAATIINFLSQQTGLCHTWKGDLIHLFSEFPNVDISQLGFPKKWQDQAGW
ncbi:Abi family protein [Agrobacterium vitis]